MLTLSHLILSAVSTAESPEDFRRIKQTVDRVVDHTIRHNAHQGMADCINAATLSWDAYVLRLEGDIRNALRYERARDAILSRRGF